MREIKFRAFDVGNEEMLEVENLYFNEMTDKVEIRTRTYSDYFNDEEMILMQYTGLKDKNGVEIYKGDIVKIIVELISREKNENETEEYIGTVTYDADDTRYKIITSKDYEFTLSLEDDLEVIGNIYENKDLLEGE